MNTEEHSWPPGQIDRKPTLLVVDDEPEMLRSIFDLLRLNYRVLTFERGSDALKALAEDDAIDVVLSDQRMPEMTGVEVLREAKRIRPEVTRLLFTGYADIRAVQDAINEGNVFRYISKPWDADEMLAVIRQAVEQHDLIAERSLLLADLKEKNARLVEVSRLKGAILEVVSHELNTPVAVVLGLTELWKLTQSQEATPAERSWVDKIHGAGKRLASTVERMFKLIRSEQPARQLDRDEVDLEAIIRKVLADISPFLDARHQVVDLRLAPDLGTAEVDQEKLADILMNLVSNAIKFTPDSGTITLIAGGNGSDWVRFAIVDRGQGIRDEDALHLFEPFFTGYDTMHHSSGDYQFGKRGIGLGLCLVKSFVELHGGHVEFESRPGEGSTFGFSIPRHSLSGIQRPKPPAVSIGSH
jgi:signal transduction histidine kinase